MGVSISQSLAGHDKAAAWTAYTAEELFWWVKLFCKRAGMRSNPEKKAKDLYDAKNYLDMLNASAKVDGVAIIFYTAARDIYEATCETTPTS